MDFPDILKFLDEKAVNLQTLLFPLHDSCEGISSLHNPFLAGDKGMPDGGLYPA